MVSFVKPNFLGTLREFSNSFIHPIQNGQCADSTDNDVRLMKNRCHVLNKMLKGCVQVIGNIEFTCGDAKYVERNILFNETKI